MFCFWDRVNDSMDLYLVRGVFEERIRGPPLAGDSEDGFALSDCFSIKCVVVASLSGALVSEAFMARMAL